MVKNLPANAGDAGDMDSIPGSEGSPCGGYGNSLQYFCLGNLGPEEPGGLQSMGRKRVSHNSASKQQLIAHVSKTNTMYEC